MSAEVSVSNHNHKKVTATSTSTLPVTIDDVNTAAKRISGFAHVTPVLTSSFLSARCGAELFFKCELFQKIGAFKFRGAMNAIKAVIEKSGEGSGELTFVTHSSGNHAQAVALAARLTGHRAVIVMPAGSNAVKKTAVIGYGATVVDCANTQLDREKTAAEQLALYPRSHLIPPYDHELIIAGQGTMALELLSQVEHLDALIVPVGGGGMLSGVCIAAKAVNPSIRIFAAEPMEAADCAESMTAGERILLKPRAVQTIADGLRTSLGVLNWPIIKTHVESVITVSEEDIVQHMKLVWERMKLLIETSAAVGVAAAMSSTFTSLIAASQHDRPIRRVGIILCGGNVDLDHLPWIKTS